MRLSNQLFGNSLQVPENFRIARTIDLIAKGLAVHLPYRGIPCFTPLGLRVLEAAQRVLLAEAERSGFTTCHLPSLMKNEDLNHGQPVGETFGSKIIRLSPPLADFHLLATPEMLMARFHTADLLSYKRLPIRVAYATDFFREMSDTHSFLTSRQFRVVGLLSIEPDQASIEDAELQVGELARAALDRLAVPHCDRPIADGFETYYLPPASHGTAPPGDKDNLMSMAIGYHYGRNCTLPIRYRTSSNSNSRGLIYSYGISMHRLFYAIFDVSRDDLGFKLSPEVRPFHLTVNPKQEGDLELALTVYTAAHAADCSSAIDDRFALPNHVRAAFSDYVGVPARIEISGGRLSLYRRGEKDGTAVDSTADAVQLAMTSIEQYDAQRPTLRAH